MRQSLFVVAFVVLIASCVHKPPAATPTGLLPADFWRDQQRRVFATSSISGKVHVRYEGNRDRVSGKGLLVAQLPDHIRLELRDPLGRTHYIAGLDKTRLVAYYPRQKLAYVDQHSGNAYLKKTFGMEVSFSELHQIMLGMLPSSRPGMPVDSWDWDAEKGAYRALIKLRGNPATVWIDGTRGTIQEMFLTVGQEKIHVEYQDFESCCERDSASGKVAGVAMAANVSVRLERLKTLVAFEWDKIDSTAGNASGSTFEIALPEGIQKIELN